MMDTWDYIQTILAVIVGNAVYNTLKEILMSLGCV